jgi:hypothetical protein
MMQDALKVLDTASTAILHEGPAAARGAPASNTVAAAPAHAYNR